MAGWMGVYYLAKYVVINISGWFSSWPLRICLLKGPFQSGVAGYLSRNHSWNAFRAAEMPEFGKPFRNHIRFSSFLSLGIITIICFLFLLVSAASGNATSFPSPPSLIQTMLGNLSLPMFVMSGPDNPFIQRIPKQTVYGGGKWGSEQIPSNDTRKTNMCEHYLQARI